jgi:hypothetical protein
MGLIPMIFKNFGIEYHIALEYCYKGVFSCKTYLIKPSFCCSAIVIDV